MVMDDDRPHVKVRQQLIRLKSKGLVIRKVKTKKSRRTLVVPGPLQDVFRNAAERQVDYQRRVEEAWSLTHGPLVFTTPIGTPIDPDNYRHQVSEVAKAAKIGHIGTHTLRRSAGSFLFAKGVPMKNISALLGHSSTRITEELYVHLLEDAKLASAELMEKALWS
jgi:integrase